MAKIYHAHLYGLREDKYQVLKENTVNSTDFQEVNPQSPFYLLIPQDTDLLGEYEQYFKITDIMPINGVGMTTARDHVVIDFEKEPILERATIFRNSNNSDEEVCHQLNIPLKKGWNLENSRKLIRKEEDLEQYITPVLYRPFDNRFIFYHDSLVWRTVKKVMKNMLLGDNFSLLTNRQANDKFTHIFCSKKIINDCTLSNATRERSYLFPLYLYPDSDKAQELQQEKRPNFSPDFLKTLETKLGYLPTPETIFYYIYAVFHSPTYRSRYAEFLKIDFPRVPLTSNDNLFRQLAEYGEQLVQLHLMTSPKLDPPLAPSSKRGGVEAPLIKGGWGDLSFVSKSDRIVAAGHPKYSKGEVHINKQGDCFKGVPEAVWNFYIGGYQVCQKWLKDRKGRTLSDEDILHYHKIVVALAETIKLMQLIDAAIPGFPIE